jgi:prolipoprotein diacylglyceryl transferase
MPFLHLLPLFVIDINIDPTFADFGPFTLTWHGFFTAVGIIAGVALAVYLGKRDGIPPEVSQELALVAVPSAIVGARLFYVVEHWDLFKNDLPDIIFGITEGGITLYGSLLGGVVGAVIYALVHRWPIGIGLDIAAPGMILGQGIGRIGDLINGEHLATGSDLPWAFRYTNPNTLGELGRAVHPTAGGYELLGDFIILALLLFVMRRYLRAPGWVFCSYMLLYSVMRFFLSYMRTDEQRLFDVPVPQWTALVLIGLSIILAGVLLKHPGPITPEYAERVWGPPEDDKAPTAGQPARA